MSTSESNDRATSSPDIFIIGNVDDHPERDLKLRKFLEVLTWVANHTIVAASVCPDAFNDEISFIRTTNYLNQITPIHNVFNYALLQLRLSVAILANIRRFDILFLFLPFPMPALIARLFGKGVVRFHGGPSVNQRQNGPLKRLFVTKVTNRLCSVITVPASNSIEHFGLEAYREKVAVAPFHVDSSFEVTTRYEDRGHVVGYLGELSTDKGFDMFVDACTGLIHDSDLEVSIAIGGRGSLKQRATEFAKYDQVSYEGWVNHSDVPTFFNGLKLTVLASNSEGLPTVALESMACGTPLLATPVGGIPDLIEDGTSGFLLSNPDSNALANKIRACFHSADMEKVSSNAQETIAEQYSLREVRHRYATVLDTVTRRDT